MALQPEQHARENIDRLLEAASVIAAKKEGVTLTGVETQSDKYTQGLPAGLPCSTNPMPSLHCCHA